MGTKALAAGCVLAGLAAAALGDVSPVNPAAVQRAAEAHAVAALAGDPDWVASTNAPAILAGVVIDTSTEAKTRKTLEDLVAVLSAVERGKAKEKAAREKARKTK